jgi:hypothetical protein
MNCQSSGGCFIQREIRRRERKINYLWGGVSEGCAFDTARWRASTGAKSTEYGPGDDSPFRHSRNQDCFRIADENEAAGVADATRACQSAHVQTRAVGYFEYFLERRDY